MQGRQSIVIDLTRAKEDPLYVCLGWDTPLELHKYYVQSALASRVDANRQKSIEVKLVRFPDGSSYSPTIGSCDELAYTRKCTYVKAIFMYWQ